MSEKKTSCTCGECNVCRTRERMRRLRAARKAVRAEHATPKAPNKRATLPNKASLSLQETAKRYADNLDKHIKATKGVLENLEKVRQKYPNARVHTHGKQIHVGLPKVTMSNLGIWVRGADPHHFEGLEHAIRNTQRSFDREMRELKTRIQQHHVKTIKGQEYIYSKYNGETRYHGKHDPRPELQERLDKLEDGLKDKEKAMRSCVIKKIGDHYVIDLETFKKEIKGTNADIIKLGEVLS